MAGLQLIPVPRVADSISSSLNNLVSKTAQRAYLRALILIITSIILLFISAVAYWVFYYNFIPQIGLERRVHLQFGDGNPYGTALLGPELVSAQKYDVSVRLNVPRTPANRAAGNFMLDLALFSQSADSIIADLSAQPVAHSRRTAILTYTSPLVDTAHRVSRMPFYVFGWRREAERLDIGMIERIEFPNGKGNMPQSLRLELQSLERMQIYDAVVRFDARFSGLRWLMYNWRIASFVTFCSIFWIVATASASAIWMSLSSIEEEKTKEEKEEEVVEEELESSEAKEESLSDTSVKSESDYDEEDEPGPSSHSRHVSWAPTPPIDDDDAEQIRREEEIEESTMIEPLVSDSGEAVSENEPGMGRSTQSTFVRGEEDERSPQRRRAHDGGSAGD
ncbi:hypothetical protein AJ80_02596 [Polytolypa hystricis UAMH7299]|uniref:Seipin n=1 Tax=Polytolypa hystricis (strain UAMH7299) TaxID=1447883 RepID=A0A2B7YQT3_POLH7|nr:hypothetical protein AJ80_02596 [Polytolypa hystricis UAMH7299]